MAEIKSFAQALTTTQPTFVNQQDAALVAAGIIAAYTAFANGAQPVMDGLLQNYTLASVICVGEVAGVEKDNVALDPETGQPRPLPPAELLATPVPPHLASGVASTGGGCSFGYTQIGFTATSADGATNLVILRGTATAEEAYYDVTGWGKNTPCLLPTSSTSPQSYGTVNSSLWKFYADTSLLFKTTLAASCASAIQKAATTNPNARWLFAAHSLGGAMITLAVMDATLAKLISGTPTIYTFGSLHVGDANFAAAYNAQCPNTLRVANLSDFVPSMVSLYPATWTDPYVHVGQETTFIWQNWDDWANHSMANIYQVIVNNNWDLLYWGPRTYPQ